MFEHFADLGVSKNSKMKKMNKRVIILVQYIHIPVYSYTFILQVWVDDTIVKYQDNWDLVDHP